MAERTDGPPPGTDHETRPLAVVAGNALEGKANLAYRAYLDHMGACPACPRSAFQCATAADLWRAYREIRGQE